MNIDKIIDPLHYKVEITTDKHGQEILKLYEKAGFHLNHLQSFSGVDRFHELTKFYRGL